MSEAGTATTAAARARKFSPEDILILKLVAAAGDDGKHSDAIQDIFKPIPTTEKIGRLWQTGMVAEKVDDLDESVPKVYVITDTGLEAIRKNSDLLAKLPARLQPHAKDAKAVDTIGRKQNRRAKGGSGARGGPKAKVPDPEPAEVEPEDD